MENAVEALKMAGAVLLFVIALSVAILAFTTSRESLDKIVKYADRESLTIENDSRFYYLANNSDTKRYVGNETIIPTIYRAYKENFKVVFNFKDSYFLYKKLDQNNLAYNVNKIDLKYEDLSNDSDSRDFLNGLLYGADKTKYNNSINYKKHFIFIYELPSTSLYDYISDWLGKGHKIEENLGTYYIEDVGSSESNGESDLTENNKNEKRVITYTFTD